MSRNNGNADGNGDANGRLDRESSEALELPLLTLPSQHPCHRCGECCRYVAIEIDKPTSNRDYENVFWYLTHRDISVYVDWESDWYIEFKTVCEHLTEQATCGIYRERPQICSEFSWTTCERNTAEDAARYKFESPQQFVDWLQVKRPKSFKRYMKFREVLIEKRQAGAGPAPKPARGRPGDPARP